MKKNYSNTEQYIISLFSKNSTFIFDNKRYKTLISAKPTTAHGEPKTDVYILASDSSKNELELKISIKQENADFLENKITDERAKELFGSYWMDIIKQSIDSISHEFYNEKLIFIDNCNKTCAGSFTLGWRFELLNKRSGKKSALLKISNETLYEIYSGCCLPADKKDAYVNGQIIKNSGVAEYILNINGTYHSAQDVINDLQDIYHYILEHQSIYFACKAVNYRSFEKKLEGNRHLAVYVDWFINNNNKLDYNIVFNNPLKTRGNEVNDKLISCLNKLGIETTNDINESLIEHFDNIVYKKE